jgi:hypothetical protein
MGNTSGERIAERVAGQLDIRLPGNGLPFVAKAIAFLMIAGGLSLSGTLLVDVLTGGAGIQVHLWRLIVALFIAVIGYLLIRRRRTALWLFAMAGLVGGIFNPGSLIVTVPIVAYLIAIRRWLAPGLADRWWARFTARFHR